MTQEERWAQVQGMLTTIASDVAVIRSEINTIRNRLDDHEQRLRVLEDATRDNTIARRAIIFAGVPILGSLFSVAGAVISRLVDK